MVHVPFSQEKFASVFGKGRWVVLSYSVAKEIQGLRLSPLGVKDDRDRQLWWLGDYRCSNLNS